MRPDCTERYYKVFTYQNVDRVVDREFGYWPQTIRRWLAEGLPAEMESEKNKMFSGKLDAFFGFESIGRGLSLPTAMNPKFDEQIIERKASSQIVRGGDGVVAERFPNEADESSIPHFLEFPVKTPDDWAAMKQRYRLDDPTRAPDQQQVADARAAADSGRMILTSFCGFYGQLRNWMGFENLSTAFYDYPEMIHDMVNHWAELCAAQVEALPPDFPIDHVCWWEDMASKNGPFVGPGMFREFLQPGYHRVMTQAKKHGCVLGYVDCDGNPHDIVGNWLEEGVNIMFPLEVSAGVDPYAWRREFGKELRLCGGVAKAPLVAGGAAIDRELERLKPLLDQGGFIPHLDHLVPPDISLKNYLYYLDKKRKMIGK
jgi:uroporphyrinogen decarboxylase